MSRIGAVIITTVAMVLSGCGKGEKANRGQVTIITTPGDARIFINGKRKGTSPAKPKHTFSIKLPEGEYVVEARKQTRGRFEYYGKKEIFVADDAIQTVDIEL